MKGRPEGRPFFAPTAPRDGESAVVVATPVIAAESSAAAEVRTFLTDHGVSATTQDNLIAVLDAGGTIDSMESDAAPVRSEHRSGMF